MLDFTCQIGVTSLDEWSHAWGCLGSDALVGFFFKNPVIPGRQSCPFTRLLLMQAVVRMLGKVRYF